MKKYSILALVAILGTCSFYSCNKEKDLQPEENIPAKETPAVNPQENEGDAVMVFSASVGDPTETKTYITTPEASGPNKDKYVPKWNSSDKINVKGVVSAAGVRSADFTTASFTLSEEVTGPFYAIAPAEVDGDGKEKNRTWDSENTRFSVLVKGTGAPQVYRNYTDGSSDNRGTNPTYDMSHAILAAYSENTSLQFQQLTTYFKLTFTKGAGVEDGTKIKTIYVRQAEAADTPNIAGTWRVTFDGSGNASIVPSNLTAIIAYNCMVNGGTPTEGVEFGSPVIITLPSYNFKDGLIITVKDTEDHFQSFGIPAASADLSTKKGTLITKTLTYNPQSGTINSVEDWEAFAAAVNAEVEDWDLYKWVGNGTVKLGADIEAASLTRITNFKYTFDGQDHSITRTGSTVPLFETISGEVKNLVLEGSMTKTGDVSGGLVPLAYTLAAGGKITSVTNRMSLTTGTEESGARDCIVAGIVKEVQGGTIEGCNNRGTIKVNIDVAGNSRLCRVAGIVADIDNVTENVLIKDCKNYTAITVNPTATANNKGVNAGALGGVAAMINSNSYTVSFNNCDNEGTIQWNAKHPLTATTDNTISIRRAICIGGIIGNGAPITKSGAWGMTEPTSDNGNKISLSYCDNSGAVNAYAISWYGQEFTKSGAGHITTVAANALQANGKVFIGGLAGALLGQESTRASITTCTNTGDITPYNNYTSGSDYASNQAGFNAVLGGLVGYGGYLSISGSTAGGTIGTKVRHMFSLGGVIGFAVRPFAISSTTVSATGYFVGGVSPTTSGDSSTNADVTANNVAYFASCPKNFGTTHTWATSLTNVVPSISGSTISSCTVSGTMSTYKCTFTTTSSRSGQTFSPVSATSGDGYWVCGTGLDQASSGVTIE